MKFFETSKYFSLKKSTYISLRWIAIIGQLITISSVYFIFSFNFNFNLASLTISIGVLSNLYLIYIHQRTQLLDKEAFFLLFMDFLFLKVYFILNEKNFFHFNYDFIKNGCVNGRNYRI